jgi:death on curing protein
MSGRSKKAKALPQPLWISKKALLLLHQESLAIFGGAVGTRDEGLLDSALARPVNAHAYRPESTISDLAASYAFGLAKNHAFADGNKRAAFLAIGLFLGINGIELIADQVDAIQTILALAAGELTEQQLSDWINRNSRPLDPKVQ